MPQTIKNMPAMWETWFQSLGQEDPLEESMATHPRILAWRIPWTEEPGGLQSMESQRAGHNWATNTFTFFHHLSFSPQRQCPARKQQKEPTDLKLVILSRIAQLFHPTSGLKVCGLEQQHCLGAHQKCRFLAPVLNNWTGNLGVKLRAQYFNNFSGPAFWCVLSKFFRKSTSESSSLGIHQVL